MSDDALLEFLLNYGFLFLILAAISALIPSLINKWLMYQLFGEEVSFWLLLGITALVTFLIMLAIAYLGLFDQLAQEQVPTGPGLLLIFAAYAFQVAMFSAFVTNSDLEIIPMWKWVVVLVAQAIVYFAISFAIVFTIIFIIATV